MLEGAPRRFFSGGSHSIRIVTSVRGCRLPMGGAQGRGGESRVNAANSDPQTFGHTSSGTGNGPYIFPSPAIPPSRPHREQTPLPCALVPPGPRTGSAARRKNTGAVLAWRTGVTAPAEPNRSCSRSVLTGSLLVAVTTMIKQLGRPKGDACEYCTKRKQACGKLSGCLKREPTMESPASAASSSPPAPRSKRSRSSPGGTEHRGAPMALASEAPYSPVERPREHSDYMRWRKRFRAGAAGSQLDYVEELLEHADWSIPGTDSEAAALSKELGGSLLSELLLAAAAVPRSASLSMQLESLSSRLAVASKDVAQPTAGRSSRRLAELPPETSEESLAPPPSAKALGKRRTSEADLSSTGRKAARPAGETSGAGRPPELEAAGRETRQCLKEVSAIAHDAPRKAKALLEAQQARALVHASMYTRTYAHVRAHTQARAGTRRHTHAQAHVRMLTLTLHRGRSHAHAHAHAHARSHLRSQAAAPEPTGRGNIVAKSNAATEAIFTTSGNLNESIQVVAHILQRAELRPILTSLGYTQADESDRTMVTSVADFIEQHLSSRGTRNKEAQAAFELLVKAMSSTEEKLRNKIKRGGTDLLTPMGDCDTD